VKNELLDLDEKKLEKVIQILKAYTKENGYISAEKLDFGLFPSIKRKWNRWLLQDICAKRIESVKCFVQCNTYDSLMMAFTDAALGIESYDELLEYVIRRENAKIPFEDIGELRKRLAQQGFVIKETPQFLLDRVIEFTDGNKIKIKNKEIILPA
jgi:hypothetical protein